MGRTEELAGGPHAVARISEQGGNAQITRKDKETSASGHPVFPLGKIPFVFCMRQCLIFIRVSKTTDFRTSMR